MSCTCGVEDGVPADVPLIISESGITAGRSGPGYLGVTGHAIWECDAFGTFFEQGGTAFYRPAINNGAGGRGSLSPKVALMAAGRMARLHILPILPHTSLISNGCSTRRERTRFSRPRPTLRTLPGGLWLPHTRSNGPDGNWSLMLINHDLNAAHPGSSRHR